MPDGSDEISGGNLYNADLFAALQECCEIKRVAATDFASAPLAEGIYLVDTLNLDVAKQVLRTRGPRQRFVLLVHHLPSFEPGLSASHPSLALERSVLPDFDGFIATGEFTRSWLAEQGYAARTVLMEPVFTGAPSARRSLEEDVRAVMVCNLIARKGVLEFLDRLALEFHKNSELDGATFSLEIIGRDDLDVAYAGACAEKIAREASLGRHVRLLGALPHSSVLAKYREANLFLSASRMETFGISLQEARHFGLPILAVRGGNSEHHIVEGKTGEVLDSPSELACAFLALAQNRDAHVAYFGGAQDARPSGPESWNDAAKRLLTVLAGWFHSS